MVNRYNPKDEQLEPESKDGLLVFQQYFILYPSQRGFPWIKKPDQRKWGIGKIVSNSQTPRHMPIDVEFREGVLKRYDKVSWIIFEEHWKPHLTFKIANLQGSLVRHPIKSIHIE